MPFKNLVLIMHKEYLASKMPISAKLLTRLSSVRTKLKSYPGIKLVRNGEVVKYLISDEDDERFYTIEFSKDRIVTTVYSGISPLYYMQEAILRTLSILSIIGECYQIDVKSLYPYLINLLANQQVGALERPILQEEQPRNGSDIILAKRISSLIRDNSILKAELNDLRKKLISISCLFIITKYIGTSVEMGSILKETCIDSDDVSSITDQLHLLGYKIVKTGFDKVSIVRL